MEICSWEVIAKLIELTSSVGFIPDYVAWGSDKFNSIQLTQLDLSIPYQLYAAYPLNEELSRNSKLFLDITREVFRDKTDANLMGVCRQTKDKKKNQEPASERIINENVIGKLKRF